MRDIVMLTITSLRASIGGEHYYGAFEVKTKTTPVVRPDGSVAQILRMGGGVPRHPLDGHQIKRRVDAKEALYLNKKDGDGYVTPSFRIKPGDETNRFNDVASIIGEAVRVFPTIFDETDLLLHERERFGEDYDVLVGPPDVKAALEATTDHDARERWLRENGYTALDIDPVPYAHN